MKFCSKCDNMCYISIDENNPNIIKHYCRVCGNVDNSADDLCILNHENFLEFTEKVKKNLYVSKTDIKKEKNYKNSINKYTKLDPTLPHLKNIQCINPECKSNKDNKITSDVIYIRYDDKSLKNIYLCVHCDKSWKTSE